MVSPVFLLLLSPGSRGRRHARVAPGVLRAHQMVGSPHPTCGYPGPPVARRVARDRLRLVDLAAHEAVLASVELWRYPQQQRRPLAREGSASSPQPPAPGSYPGT